MYNNIRNFNINTFFDRQHGEEGVDLFKNFEFECFIETFLTESTQRNHMTVFEIANATVLSIWSNIHIVL